MCKKNINNFTLHICVYLDYDLYSMQIWYTTVHKSTGWTWNITGNSQKSLTAHFFRWNNVISQPEFYANASLSSQVLCRPHNIYMYLGEYSTNLWLSVK